MIMRGGRGGECIPGFSRKARGKEINKEKQKWVKE
jgi:hypothetical protein